MYFASGTNTSTPACRWRVQAAGDARGKQPQHPAHNHHRELQHLVKETADGGAPLTQQVQRDAQYQAEADNLQHIGSGNRIHRVRWNEIAQEVGEGRGGSFGNLLRQVARLQHSTYTRLYQMDDE
jgi:hypothetical protein